MTDQQTLAEFSRRLAIFSINVYSELALLKPNSNLVFSPFSIQTCAAMARIGAEHQTATELDQGLGLMSHDVAQIADNFHQVLSAYEQSSILRIANKIYVMQGYSVRPDFNELISKKFLSSADEIDFNKNNEAAQTINAWIASKTNNLIRDLVPASALDRYTRIVLLNAIHFKGEWKHQFPKHATQNDDFYISESESVQVPMMNLKSDFRYADLPNLDATALEMPYKDSDLSMLVLLPNSRTGLKALEQKLKSTHLNQITEHLRSRRVIVKFPKFKAEFEIELSETFKQLGMSRMFSSSAEFGKMLDTKEQLQVSKVIHKAYIDVSEEGTEAAAATGVVMCFASMPTFQAPPTRFFVNRAFYYAIINQEQNIIFAGNMHQP